MPDDDYDLLPHSELKKIESEINTLKTNPGSAPSSMQKSINDLSMSLKSMMNIFNEAKNELRIEDEEKELVSKKIDPILQKLDNLLDQNEKIAEGILSVADMVHKLEAKMDNFKENVDTNFTAMSSAPKPSQPSQPPMDAQPSHEDNIFQQQGMQQPAVNAPNPAQHPGMQPVSPPGFKNPGDDPFGSPASHSPAQGQPNPADADPFSDLGGDSSSSPAPGLGAGADSTQAPPGTPGMPGAPRASGTPGMPPPPPPKPPKKKGFFGK